MSNLNSSLTQMEAIDLPSLLEQARAGESEAFCEVCRVYETRLLRQAVALCSNPTLAGELAQDTLVEAWKCLRRYDGRCQFFTWLCAILLNRYRNVLREKRPLAFSALPRNAEDELAESFTSLADDHPLPDVASESREEADLLHRCVQALPPKHQQVIYLRFYSDDSLEGIAAALGCSVGTVKSRLFHALERLRKMNALKGRRGRVIENL